MKRANQNQIHLLKDEPVGGDSPRGLSLTSSCLCRESSPVEIEEEAFTCRTEYIIRAENTNKTDGHQEEPDFYVNRSAVSLRFPISLSISVH